jgi:hypothetical protein
MSFVGTLSEPIEALLYELKERAQSPDEFIAVDAQITLGEHLFEVSDRGRRKFPFVLNDNWFGISLSSRNARKLPLAHVQISSELLTAIGPRDAVAKLAAIIADLGEVTEQPSISRADAYVDFQTDLDFETIPRKNWVRRSRNRAIYETDDQVTGIMFGGGGDISARIYDKTVELQKSGKEYLLSLWEQAGRDPARPVWRLEFQLRRVPLVQLGIFNLDQLLEHLPRIWSYLMTDWLRLAIPNPEDDTRTRWPTHPAWTVLSSPDDLNAPSQARVSRQRAPSDLTMFRNGLAGLTSFMALEGIVDVAEGISAYLHAAKRHHAGNDPSNYSAEPLESYVGRKVIAKARRFNTPLNRHEPG